MLKTHRKKAHITYRGTKIRMKCEINVQKDNTSQTSKADLRNARLV